MRHNKIIIKSNLITCTQILNLHKIWYKPEADDPQVIRFYKNSGYQIEGTLKEHEYKEPHFIDKILFAKIT